MDFGSRENYTPEMAEYLLRSFEREFDFIICDAGCEADHGLSLGSLFCSDRVYMLIRQSEVCFSRTAWALPLYRQLRINFGALVLCGFEKSSPYTKEYAAERFSEKSSGNLEIAGSLGILTIRKSRYGSDSETDCKSIYSYGEAGYSKDMTALEEDAAASLGFSAAHRENGRRGLWKNSVSGKR
ncbi:MAG: hypothetical protein MJ186_03725 [Clostridia bacterium]|nr:hypothetical protein [Clostridia bacterium]